MVQIEPLVTEEEFEQAKKDVEEFGAEGGVGEMLHAHLVQRAKECTEEHGDKYPHGHWLEEWWDKFAYLAGRDPLPVNTNGAWYLRPPGGNCCQLTLCV